MVSDRRLASRRIPTAKKVGGRSRDSRNGGGADDDEGDWDPAHFRLFVGNLGTDASDDLLKQGFAKYKLVTKCKAVMDKSGTPKGYGFVAFSDANDYLKAFQEMNGKYIGLHPVMLKRAVSTVPKAQKNKKPNKGK